MQLFLTWAYGCFVIVYLMWILRYSLRPERHGIPVGLFVGLFLFKSIAALLCFYYLQHLGSTDAVSYTREVDSICRSLHFYPQRFIREFITDWGRYPQNMDILSRDTRFWEQLGLNIHRRVLILCNLLSFGNPYIISLWFAVISFVGQWYIFRVFLKFYTKFAPLIFVFVSILPLVAFWSPAISKEGYTILAFAMIAFHTYQLKFQSRNWKHIVGLIVGFVLLFMVRNFYVFSLTPFYLLWVLTPRESTRNVYYYLLASLVSIGIFIGSSYLPESNGLNIYQRTADRQAEFLSHKGSDSYLHVDALAPHAANLGRVIMQSVDHVFLRPYITDISKVEQLFYLLSNWLDLLIILSSILMFRSRDIRSSFFWFILCFSLSNLVLIGMTVPAYGAIARYKMVFSMLLVTIIFMQQMSTSRRTSISNQ